MLLLLSRYAQTAQRGDAVRHGRQFVLLAVVLLDHIQRHADFLAGPHDPRQVQVPLAADPVSAAKASRLKTVLPRLTLLKPKTVIFSMGMNDINMTTKEKYCENYKNLLTKVQAALPNAKLCVASITPITTASKFSTNTKIDGYNAAIRDYLAANYPSWHYVNVAPGLKNEYNALRSNYTSGDGIHLAPAAYQVILSQVCRQLAPSSGTTAAN